MAPMLNKEMAKIDWNNKTAKEIKIPYIFITFTHLIMFTFIINKNRGLDFFFSSFL